MYNNSDIICDGKEDGKEIRIEGETMKIAICDDRENDRNALRALLEAYGQDFEIREYSSGSGLCGDMDYIRECGIIFLDINMDGMDGLETARQIKAECPKVYIVLVTAYVNYALDGYKVKASRFLLKDDLEQTLQECMDDILQEIRQDEQVVEYGFVEGNVRLRVDDIIYIETNKHKNVFYTQQQTFSIYKKMDELEEDLKGMGFVRMHRSFLVNMKYIEKISSYVMVLTTGKRISVPKSRYPEVKRQYTLFKGTE
ncbi:MAG: LytTR family DNA-binding domain-containing protein [Lachnospiraceae bacterium]|nr:LytTR family DNA-binding domain-containing protein [Lachnospiraceae bacterium]